jgi:hypothetical protein
MIQTLRPQHLGSVGAAVVVLSGIALSSFVSPVQAATFDRFSFGGFARLDNPNGRLNNSADTATIDFAETIGLNSVFGTPSGTDYGLEISGTGNRFQQIAMQDITGLVKEFQDLTVSEGQERERWARNYATPLTWLDSPDWDFKLTRFVLRRSMHNSSLNPGNNDFVGDIFGYFEFNDGTQRSLSDSGNLLTGQVSLALQGGGSYSADLYLSDAIPTPALLPGIIGVSAQLWRKRKGRLQNN